MTLFDSYVVVDWSSLGKPSRAKESANAIWIASAGADLEAPTYCRTRQSSVGWLEAKLLCLLGKRRRVLVGFDFPFGYPVGFAEAVTGCPQAFAVWAELARRIRDAPDNANNRFLVAGQLNAALAGVGPFWGNGLKADVTDLPRTRNGSNWGVPGLPERRIVERRYAKGAKTCWQISGAGSVGGQVLTGLPRLHRLRAHPELGPAIRVWPIETGLATPDATIVLAEIYPSLWSTEIAAARERGEILDRAQVCVTASAFEALDAAGELAALFCGPASLTRSERAQVVDEEGWILGAGGA